MAQSIGTNPPNIPQWLVDRYHNMAHLQQPRHEASWYGVVNGWLNVLFPITAVGSTTNTTATFLIKPQAKIRPEEAVDMTYRSSQDSYGTNVQPRGLGLGREGDIKIPDFVVVKGGADANADVPLLLVEVKRSDANDTGAREQLCEYMRAFAKKINTLPSPVKGFLISPTKVLVYTMRLSNGIYEPFEIMDDQQLTLSDGRLVQYAHNIANAA